MMFKTAAFKLMPGIEAAHSGSQKTEVLPTKPTSLPWRRTDGCKHLRIQSPEQRDLSLWMAVFTSSLRASLVFIASGIQLLLSTDRG